MVERYQTFGIGRFESEFLKSWGGLPPICLTCNSTFKNTGTTHFVATPIRGRERILHTSVSKLQNHMKNPEKDLIHFFFQKSS